LQVNKHGAAFYAGIGDADRTETDRMGVRLLTINEARSDAVAPSKTFRTDHTFFVLFVAVFVAYAALFIYRTSFVINGVRYFSLFDDAMISMRYARNLAHGYGLVWNPGGARVEGYTNPLWVFYMALIHLFPISLAKTSLVVQMTAAALLIANLFLVRKIARAVSEGSEPVALGAVALTALYLPINNWSLQGMEVSVLVLIMSVCLWQAIRCMADNAFRVWLYILLGISTFVRPDMVVPFGSFILFLAIFDRPNRMRHVAWGSVILVACWAAQTLFRFWYFGDMLPNTYYLKLTGYSSALRIFHGLWVLAQFVWNANLLLFVLPFLLAFRRDRRIWLLLWILAVQMAYSVYVGGDAWEYWGGSNRYISIAMPGFFILLSYGLFLASRLTLSTLDRDRPAGATTLKWSQGVFALLIVFAILSVNSIYGVGALAEAFLIKAPLHSGPGDENEGEVEQALLLSKITTPDAKLAVARAGTIPYFSERPGVDLLGKNDRYIAHEPMRRSMSGLHRFIEFRPGHMKYDYDHSIGQQAPDVIVQLWQHPEEARPYLEKYYKGVPLQGKCVYFRQGSQNVLWDSPELNATQNSCGLLATHDPSTSLNEVSP
jgi:arabinofuranosyltransferase